MCRAFAVAALGSLLLLVPGAFGGRTPLTGQHNYGARWSPDGTRIALSTRHQAQSDVWVANADSSRLHRVTTDEPVLHESVCWSPDGTRIVFARWDIRDGSPLPPATIEVQNVDDGTPARAIAQTPDPSLGLAWSSTDRIAYVDGDTIHAISPDGTGNTVVGVGHNPVWSPSGKELVFVRDSSVWRASPDGSDARPLATFPTGKVDGLAWSPDGSSVAFAYESAHDKFASQIWTVGADGSGSQKVVTRYNVSAPSWSPDGRTLAFSANAPTGEYPSDLFTVPAHGGPVRNVTHDNGDEDDPQFSSSGRLAYDGSWDIFTINADGTSRRNLTGTQSGLTVRARSVRGPNRLVVADVRAIVEGPPSGSRRRTPLNLIVHVMDRRGDEVDGALVSARPLGRHGLRLDRTQSQPRTGKVTRGHANIVFRRLDDKVRTGARLVFRIRVAGGGPHTGVDHRLAVVVNAS